MSKCPSCNSPLYVPKCMVCDHYDPPKVKKGAAKCEWPCQATIHVQESLTGKAIQGVMAYIGGDGAETDGNGFRTKDKLTPGPHIARISLSGVKDKYARPIGTSDTPVTKTIATGESEFFTFALDPLTPLKVLVKKRNDANGITGAKVTLTAGKVGNTMVTPEITTPAGGEALFEALRQDTYKIKTELSADLLKKFRMEQAEENHVLDMARNPDEHTVWARLIIHIKLKYKDPDGTVRFFPKDFPVTVAFNGGKTKDVKILDGEGKLEFEVDETAKSTFTLKFDSPKVRYFVHEKDKPAAEVKEDPSEEDLAKLADAGKKFFALPKVWALAQSDWDVAHIVLPADGQVAIPADGIGASDAPAELTLKPKLLHVRFEYFDRKYCESDHSKKAVSIPAVILKGARSSDAAGAPENPAAGTHDAISNWMIEADDQDGACQCLPFILTKAAADGAALPKLNNKLLVEFAREKAFVHSAGAKDRKLVILPDDDAKRKPTRDRDQYYDLPKKWKSKCYFTRFADATKNKFFDELAVADDAQLEAAWDKAGKIRFCLDDIVLVTGTSQAVKDKDETDTAQDIGEHSRFAMLFLNPKDKKFNPEIFKPRATAAYWSETEFQKESAGAVRRNAIVECPINPRVIVFCHGYYDIHDKRTDTADFAKKEILGARAAKLDDDTISSAVADFNSDAAITSLYVFRKRLFKMKYLHFAATDGTTVYGLVITLWTCRFVKDTVKGATDEVVKVYREEGMNRAMKRWNEKDYFFEESDDKHETKIKHFCLFEAKDVETSANTFATKRGGKAICTVTLKDDSNGGSSAAAAGNTMEMRRSGALDEGDSKGPGPRGNGNGWGHSRWPEHPPAHPKYAPTSQPLTAIAEYDLGNAAPANALAHELGHGAIGLWDDYVTGKYSYGTSSTKLWKYANDNQGDQEGQRFPGMPFAEDTGAIMRTNRAVRMRYYWGRAKWLNDQAKADLEKFLAKKRFRISYVPADTAKAKLKYAKPDKAEFQAYYKPVVSASSYSLGRQGKCDMHLYHLGEDEFARVLKGGPYNGILAMSFKISARFKATAWAVGTAYKVDNIVTRSGTRHRCTADHTPVLAGTVEPPMDPGQWVVVDDNDYAKMKIQYVEELNILIQDMVQNKFKLQGNGEFATTYLRIFPQWEIVEPGAGAGAGTHFQFEFSWGSDAFTPSGSTVEAGTKCKKNSLIRYIYGKIGDVSGSWPGEGGIEADLTKDDLPQVKAWMDTNATGRFNVGAI